MALEKEIWIADIQEKLFENNEFMNHAVDHSPYVSNKTVHVPQAGSAPGIQKNRTVFPAPIAERVDTEETYQIDEYTTDPILIRDFEASQLSYDKRQSILKSHTDVLKDRIAKELITNWAPTLSGRIVKTSGSDASALAPSATGTRKAITIQDVANLAKVLDNDYVPSDGRYLLMNTDLYYQLFTISDLIRSDSYGKPILGNGVVNQLFGFNIIVKPTLPVYNSSYGVKAVGSSGASTDNLACIAWQENYVARAMGNIKVFLDEDEADYYGSVFSAMVPFGGTKLRKTTEVGIAALVQQ